MMYQRISVGRAVPGGPKAERGGTHHIHIPGGQSDISGLEYRQSDIFWSKNKTEIMFMIFFDIRYC